MNYRSFFCLYFVLFVVSSCEREQTPVVENAGLPLIVKEIYSEDLYNEFTYNEQNLPKERKSRFFYTLYHYNSSNQVTSYEMYEDSRIYSSNWATAQAAMNRTDWVTPQNTEISGKAIYKYRDDQLISIMVNRAHSDIQNTTEFSYDGNGRIVNLIFSSNGEVQGRKVYTYDDHGNVIMEQQYYSSALICTKTFEYDDKHNPFKVFNRMGTPGIYTNENNILKEKLVLMEDSPGVDSMQVTESAYKYNDLGYPVTKNGFIRYEYK